MAFAAWISSLRTSLAGYTPVGGRAGPGRKSPGDVARLLMSFLFRKQLLPFALLFIVFGAIIAFTTSTASLVTSVGTANAGNSPSLSGFSGFGPRKVAVTALPVPEIRQGPANGLGEEGLGAQMQEVMKDKELSSEEIQTINEIFASGLTDGLTPEIVDELVRELDLNFEQREQLLRFIRDTPTLKEDILKKKLRQLDRKVSLRDFVRNKKPVTFDPSDYDAEGVLQPAGRKIVILTATDGGGEKVPNMTAMAVQNRDEYCRYHGYTHVFYDFSKMKEPLPHDRKGCWAKMLAVRKAFDDNPDAEWVLWLDLDIIIMNAEIDLAKHFLHPKALKNRLSYGRPLQKHATQSRFSYLPQLYPVLSLEEFHDLVDSVGIDPIDLEPPEILTDDDIANMDIIIGQDDTETNAGSLLFRRTDWMRHFLSFWEDQSIVDLNTILIEQDVMGFMMGRVPYMRKKMGLVSQKLISPFLISDNDLEHVYCDGDFSAHFAGRWGMEDVWKGWWEKRIRVPEEYRSTDVEFKFDISIPVIYSENHRPRD